MKIEPKWKLPIILQSDEPVNRTVHWLFEILFNNNGYHQEIKHLK